MRNFAACPVNEDEFPQRKAVKCRIDAEAAEVDFAASVSLNKIESNRKPAAEWGLANRIQPRVENLRKGFHF
jgi:hypothetical protein